MNLLKVSTAVTLRFGPFLDDTDGKTAETALSLVQADVRLTKNNGVFAQKNDATTATHEENGWYQVPLNTTDTNTVGHLTVAVHKTGALPVFGKFFVVAANVYDAMVGTDKLFVDAVELNSSTTAAVNLGKNGLTQSPFTVLTGSTTTNILTDLTEATNQHYNGVIIRFISGVLQGQFSKVTDYTGATKALTVEALTEAPANGDLAILG